MVGSALVCGAILWLSLICFMRERIALAISIVRESVKALMAMPLLCFFPIIQSALFGGFTALWTIYSIYLVSSGTLNIETDPITGVQYKKLSYDKNSRHAMVFIFFVWIWGANFIEAFGQLVSAHAVLVWYFRPKGRGVACCQVITSACVCARYHLGTAALGSLLVSIVQAARVFLEYIQFKLQANRNILTRFALCCLGCCLCVLERCLKYLTSQAYVQTALHGASFCRAGRRAFSLILHNLGRVATVASIANLVVMIGQMSISLTCAGLGYYYMTNYRPNEVSGVVMPVVLIGYIAYRVSSVFLGVVSATCGTILQAYLVEEASVSKAVRARSPRESESESGGEGGLGAAIASIRAAQDVDVDFGAGDGDGDDVDTVEFHHIGQGQGRRAGVEMEVVV